MSARAAFNAALDAWSAGAGSELLTEEDIKIIKQKDFLQEYTKTSDGMGGGGKEVSGKGNLERSGIIEGQVGK